MFSKLIHGGVVRKLILAAGGRYVGGEIHEAASGHRGEFLRHLYLWAQGKKTVTGVVLACTAAALPAFGLGDYQELLGYLAGGLIGVGLLDKTWRSRPEWDKAPAWRFVRDHWADVVAILTGATAALTRCDGSLSAALAHVHIFGRVLTCHAGVVLVGALTAVGGWLFAEAYTAPAPKAAVAS